VSLPLVRLSLKFCILTIETFFFEKPGHLFFIFQNPQVLDLSFEYNGPMLEMVVLWLATVFDQRLGFEDKRSMSQSMKPQ